MANGRLYQPVGACSAAKMVRSTDRPNANPSFWQLCSSHLEHYAFLGSCRSCFMSLSISGQVSRSSRDALVASECGTVCWLRTHFSMAHCSYICSIAILCFRHAHQQVAISFKGAMVRTFSGLRPFLLSNVAACCWLQI